MSEGYVSEQMGLDILKQAATDLKALHSAIDGKPVDVEAGVLWLEIARSAT